MDFLQRLAWTLDRLQAPTGAELRDALRHIACRPDDIRSYAADPLPGTPYGRRVLYRSDELEAIVVHLPPGASTSIHDHGESVGCANVIEGSICNVLYRKKGFGMAGVAGRLEAGAGHWLAAPFGQIHQLRNAGADRAVSLHLYAPPLKGMRSYLPEEEAVLDFVI